MTTRATTEGWILIAIALVITVPMLGLTGLGLMSLVPSDLELVERRAPPMSVKQRQEPGPGCGLNQTTAPEGCADLRGLSHRSTNITFPSRLEDGLQLKGTLTVPDTAGPRPGVVFIGGSGPTPRDSTSPGDLLVTFDEPKPIARWLAEHLAQQGVVTLRYDKRTCAACYPDRPIELSAFRFEHLVTDARDAVAWLADRPEVDPNAIVVIGHSQGGTWAPLVAAGEREHVAGVVLLAGSSDGLGALLHDQLNAHANIRGSSGDLWTAWAESAAAESIRRCLGELNSGDFKPEAACVAPNLTQGMLAEYNTVVRRVPDALRAVKRPFLVVHGSLDINIRHDQIVSWQSLLNGQDAEFHRLSGVSHPMTQGDHPTHLAPATRDTLDRFLASVRRVASE